MGAVPDRWTLPPHLDAALKGKEGPHLEMLCPSQQEPEWKKQEVVLWEIVFLDTVFLSFLDVQISL